MAWKPLLGIIVCVCYWMYTGNTTCIREVAIAIILAGQSAEPRLLC
jgi:hypothetical protein